MVKRSIDHPLGENTGNNAVIPDGVQVTPDKKLEREMLGKDCSSGITLWHPCFHKKHMS